jgi:predicted heme/steroid binding protein
LAVSTANGSAGKAVPTNIFRFVVGYLHILFGFFWFGTILYVHLILKPAYASRGLPRGEVKLGLVSMVVMGVTGVILFSYRVPDPSILLSTRFGVLLLIKITLYLIMVCSALFAVFVLGPRLRRKRVQEGTIGDGALTLEQLAQFDGKDDRKAYFAYQGDIYDATGSPLWKNGNHMGRHQAGGDLTEVLSQAPHGEDKIKAMKVVDSLFVDEKQEMSPPQKVFYTMAYMNLGFVLLIILVLACWRWW